MACCGVDTDCKCTENRFLSAFSRNDEIAQGQHFIVFLPHHRKTFQDSISVYVVKQDVIIFARCHEKFQAEPDSEIPECKLFLGIPSELYELGRFRYSLTVFYTPDGRE